MTEIFMKKACTFLTQFGLTPDDDQFRPAEYSTADGSRILIVVVADNDKIRDWFAITTVLAGYYAQLMYLNPAYAVTIVGHRRIFARGYIKKLTTIDRDWE